MTLKPQNLIVYEWEKNIPTDKDKSKYDAILAKQKKITNSQIISKLNQQTIKADHVILRQFLTQYSKPQQLNSPASFCQIKSFFDLLKTNYETVQLSYLQIGKNKSNEPEQTEDPLKEINFFQPNKINLSKFIKDEPEHYKKSIEANIYKVKGMENETGIPAQNVHKFLKNLLQDTKHIEMYENNLQYFTMPEYEQKIIDLVKRYTIEVKELPEHSFAIDQIYITEEEVLEFLTFCLKSSNDIVIVYARTQKVLSKLEKQYLQKLQTAQKDSPSNRDNQEPTGQEKKQAKANDITHNLQFKIKIKNSFEQLPKQFPSQAILRRYRQKTPSADQDNRPLKNSLSKSMTKQQKLQKLLPELYTFACKRRTRIHKGTTFDEIQEDAKLMNLQKFINFCKYLQINDLIARQLLIEEFKLHAINRLTLNVEKFGILLQKLIQKNIEVLNKLLSLQKLVFAQKKDKMIKIIKEEQGKSLSKYKYRLLPVNGKDIESLELELQEKKRQKELMKKEKEGHLLKMKQQGLFAKYQTILQQKGQRQKMTSIQDSNITLREANEGQNNQFKYNIKKKRNFSEKFNPQSLISNYEEQDALWDEYESKIWRRQGDRNNVNTKNRDRSRNQSQNQSILEEALSKRIQKGNKVLQKINSSNLKYYQIL